MAKPNTSNTTFAISSVVSGPIVSLVFPTFKNTSYYWNRLRVHNSLCLRKHHLADHFKLVLISCFLHCSKQWFHLDIQNAICDKKTAVTVGLCAFSLLPAEIGTFSTSWYQHSM